MATNWGTHRPHAVFLEEAIPALTLIPRTTAGGGGGGGGGEKKKKQNRQTPQGPETVSTRWGDLIR